MAKHWEEHTRATVGPRENAPGDAERVIAVVRRRARDDADAALLLDALGLAGERQLPAKLTVIPWVHGSQGGVDHHREAGHGGLCRACQRWLDLKEGRADECGEGCGDVQSYWRHRRLGEPTCGWSREAYRVHCAGRRAAGGSS